MEVGGFFFYFEAIRTASSDRDAPRRYRHAMRLDGRHYNAWYGLGAIYYRQEKYALAEYHFQRALSMNPGSSVLHCYLGMTYHANKRCHDALRHLRLAAAAEPNNP